MVRVLLLGFQGRMAEALELMEATEELPKPWHLYRRRARRALDKLPKARWRLLFKQARFRSAIGDLGAARGLYEEALAAVEEDDPADEKERKALMSLHYNAACLQAQASAGRTTLKEAPDPADPALADELREKSLKNLRRAVALGWTDLDKLAQDPDLEPLRDLPAFGKLLGK